MLRDMQSRWSVLLYMYSGLEEIETVRQNAHFAKSIVLVGRFNAAHFRPKQFSGSTDESRNHRSNPRIPGTGGLHGDGRAGHVKKGCADL